MVERLTYRRHNRYNTNSNKCRTLRTPGGKLVLQVLKKKGKTPACGDCGKKLIGLPALRPIEYRRLKNRERRVSRAYGGSRCGKCVRSRIVRAFLIEEQKIVKQVLAEKAAALKDPGTTRRGKKSK
mmetsp:Transcript_105003/g.292247  ORF Transcript_105003/g.292247 Transcript_105003/m.292247 type:complete len:126 (-) Transcript_105003:56-433(-)